MMNTLSIQVPSHPRRVVPSMAILGVLMIGLIGPETRAVADAPSSSVLDRARRLCDFETRSARGREILGYLHFGSTFKSCQEVGVYDVKDTYGRPITDQFALLFRWKWDAGSGVGTTDVAFFFDARGELLGLKMITTDATFNQPFFLADVSIQLLGQVILKAFEDDMKESDRRQLQAILEKADSKGLLEWSLKFQQLARR